MNRTVTIRGWKRHHAGWWDNTRTGATLTKGDKLWWLLRPKSKPVRYKSFNAAIKAAQ